MFAKKNFFFLFFLPLSDANLLSASNALSLIIAQHTELLCYLLSRMFLSRFRALGDLVLIRYAWLKCNKINSEVHSVRERNRRENVTENESTTEASASTDEHKKKTLTGAAQPNWHAKSIFQSNGLKGIYDGTSRQVGIHNAVNVWAKETQRRHLELSHRACLL